MTGRYPPASRKLLVVALDAASPELLRAWAADGTLPAYAGLLARGVSGDNQGIGGLEAATWPTFYTGFDAGGHGFYWLDQLEPGTYRNHWFTAATLRRRRAFWELLGEAGRRLLLLDVPLSPPSPGLNGAQVLEWGTHDPLFGFQATPARLARQIRQSAGSYPAPHSCDVERRSLAEYRGFADQLIAATRAKARLTRELLAGEPWDFAMQVFTETHCAGHQFWHFHDPAHPGFSAETTASTGNLLREVYVAADAALGEVLAGLDSETTVVVLSLHGMSCMAGRTILLPEILVRLGMLTPAAEGPWVSSQPRNAGERLARGIRKVYHRVPRSIRLPLFGLRQRFNRRWRSLGETLTIDPARTRCFPVEVGRGWSAVRLNLRGREPQGIVAPGSEAEGCLDELTRELLQLRDPASGQRLVQQVSRVGELYHGEELHRLPDLVIGWNHALPLGSSVVGNGAGALARAQSARVGTVEVENHYCRSGDHLVPGCFVAAGPGLRPGRVTRMVSNQELAPTFAKLLGCEIPWSGGGPIPELLGE